MDNNLIKSVEQKDVIATDSPFGLRAFEGFENGFLATTTALGVWPVSLGICAVITCLSMIVSDWLFSSGSTTAMLVSNAISSVLTSIATWMVLGFFGWPRPLRIILSIWGAMAIGLLAVGSFCSVVNVNNLEGVLAVLSLGVIWQSILIPSAIVGFIALIPYVYRDHLLAKHNLPDISSSIPIEERKMAESELSSPSADN